MSYHQPLLTGSLERHGPEGAGMGREVSVGEARAVLRCLGVARRVEG
jgi:hypothetical protein